LRKLSVPAKLKPNAKGAALDIWEVSLVKAMLQTEKYSRQDIVANFSRPGRTINPARISEISDGKRHKSVPQASGEQLTAYLERFPDSFRDFESFAAQSPLHISVLSVKLPIKSGAVVKLDENETESIEFKSAINWGSMAEYARTMAGFSNNRGGYLVFGVDDSTRKIVGVSEDKLKARDPARTTQFLNQHFTPSIRWEQAHITIEGKHIAIMYTWASQMKPVMCQLDSGSTLKSGQVYFRYAGLTEQIRVGELSRIIQEREKAIESRWMHLMSRIGRIGVDNVAVLDTVSGRLEGRSKSLLIDQALVSQLTFIKEGEFSEKIGTPTLKLIGEVKPVVTVGVAGPAKISQVQITDNDLVRDFILQAKIDAPLQYIRHLGYTQTLWLPVFYFLEQASISSDEAAVELRKELATYPYNVQKQVKRLRLRRGPPSLSPSSSFAEIRASFLGGTAPETTTQVQAISALRMLRAVKLEIKHRELSFAVLSSCWKLLEETKAHKLRQELRYATSYVDLMYFGTQTVPGSTN
jgi:hypothetical protein